jgi:hypothetical protein
MLGLFNYLFKSSIRVCNLQHSGNLRYYCYTDDIKICAKCVVSHQKSNHVISQLDSEGNPLPLIPENLQTENQANEPIALTLKKTFHQKFNELSSETNELLKSLWDYVSEIDLQDLIQTLKETLQFREELCLVGEETKEYYKGRLKEESKKRIIMLIKRFEELQGIVNVKQLSEKIMMIQKIPGINEQSKEMIEMATKNIRKYTSQMGSARDFDFDKELEAMEKETIVSEIQQVEKNIEKLKHWKSKVERELEINETKMKKLKEKAAYFLEKDEDFGRIHIDTERNMFKGGLQSLASSLIKANTDPTDLKSFISPKAKNLSIFNKKITKYQSFSSSGNEESKFKQEKIMEDELEDAVDK